MPPAAGVDVLVVAEKPGVARAFARYLSSGDYRVRRVNGVTVYEFRRGAERWAVLGVSGHLMDFDFPRKYNSWRSVDPRQLFFIAPIRVLRSGMRKYVRVLESYGRVAKRVILALDADVEGESIAFEVMSIISRVNPNATFERAWFSAVTRSDIMAALKNLGKPNENLANKAFARMVLDLTIGAAFTRALTLLVERRGFKLPRGHFLSYGPCQTPVLYLVVKRELEREKFKKKRYYVVEAVLSAAGFEFKASYAGGKFEDKSRAVALASRLRGVKRGEVVEAEYRHIEVRPPPPLNTVEMERRASHFLNIRAKEVMDIAEDLYQEGLISYPRTDTNKYPPTLNLKSIAEKFTAYEPIGWFVREVVLRGEIKPTAGREDDRAHPPIYPLKAVGRDAVVKRFGEKGWKLYDFVVRHFIATLSPPAVVERQRVSVKIGDTVFTATGLKVVDEGYYVPYPFERPREAPLPYLLEGDAVEVKSISVREAETKPPPYLSEAELLALMKKYGIGTDATMQDHIHTNVKRKYFVIRRKRCIPTPLGRALALALAEVVPGIILPEVRGKMERELARIASGEKEPGEVVSEVKSEFLEYFDTLRRNEEKLAQALISALHEVYGKRTSRV